MSAVEDRIRSSFARQGLMATFGARLVHVVEGEVHVALPFDAGLSQQRGFVHAGAVASIVDTACGYAALTVAPPEHEVVTVEFKVNFVRPAIGQRFLAIGRVVTAGRQLTVCTGQVVAHADGADKVVALMQATVMNVRAAG